jgi:hypothetical protein
MRPGRTSEPCLRRRRPDFDEPRAAAAAAPPTTTPTAVRLLSPSALSTLLESRRSVMPSSQRPIIVGLASAFVASSSSPGLVHRTLASTSAIGARSFALSSPARASQRATKVTPAQATEGASREVKDGSADYHVKSYMEVMADINETKAAAQTKAAEAQSHMKKQAEQVRSNPEARKSLNVMPINTNGRCPSGSACSRSAAPDLSPPSVYLNLPPYNVARQQACFKTVKFFKAKVEVWLAMTQ